MRSPDLERAIQNYAGWLDHAKQTHAERTNVLGPPHRWRLSMRYAAVVLAIVGLTAVVVALADGKKEPPRIAATGASAECFEVPVSSDGLPAVASHTDDRQVVERALSDWRARIVQDVPGIDDLRVVNGYWRAWSPGPDGLPVITARPDFAIGGTVVTSESCPRTPMSYDGIPLRIFY